MASPGRCIKGISRKTRDLPIKNGGFSVVYYGLIWFYRDDHGIMMG
jgi:hypothetical protein